MRHASRAQVQAMHWPVLEPIEADDPAKPGEKPALNPIALSKPVCVAGARSRVNLALESPLVSRAHALFVTDADSVYVRDLASLNHLFLNDAAVRESALHEGDVVRIGPFSFRCQGGFPTSGNGHTPPAQLQQLGSDYVAEVTGRSAVIGSRQGCDVQLSDSAVEPVHAVIFHREGRWHLRDLRSSTGTYVNDELVGQIELKPGDIIRIGKESFRFQVGADVQEVELPEVIDNSQPVALEEPPEPKPAAAAVEPALEDSTIPLLDESISSEPLREAPEQPQPVEPAPPAPNAAEPLIPEPPPPVPQQTQAEDRIPVHHEPEEEKEQVPLPVEPESAPPLLASRADEMSPLPHEPGNLSESTVEENSARTPRHELEEHFSEILDDLSANVEELHSAWRELKTSGEDPSFKPQPGKQEATDEEQRVEADRKAGSADPARPPERQTGV